MNAQVFNLSKQNLQCLSLSKKYFRILVCLLHICIILKEQRKVEFHCSHLHMCNSWLPDSGSRNVVWVDQIKIEMIKQNKASFPLRKWSERQSLMGSSEVIKMGGNKASNRIQKGHAIQNCPLDHPAVLQPPILNVHLIYKQRAGPFGPLNLYLWNCYSSNCLQFF